MKRKIIFVLTAFILSFALTGKVNAATTNVATGEELAAVISNAADPGLIVKLTANIKIDGSIAPDGDLDIVINGGDKTLDLNGYTLTVEGSVIPKWYSPHTLYITDSGENGTIVSTNAYNPINYQSNQVGNTAKMTINGGTFIVNYSDMFFTNCHDFIFTINDGAFKSGEDMIDTAGGFAPQVTIKKLTFEAISKDDRYDIHIGINSVEPISDWLATGSDLYYISSTGKALYRSNTAQGKKFKANGSLLITNEPITSYYLIDFHDYVGANSQEQYLTAGQQAVEPVVEVPNGKTFMGWYTDETYTTKYNFNNYVYSDIDLYAKWEYTAVGSIGDTAEFATQTVGYDGVHSFSVPIFIDNEVTVNPARLQATLTGTNPEAFEFYLNTSVGMMEGPGMWNTESNFNVGPQTGLAIGNYSAVLTLKYDQDNDGVYEVTIGSKQLLFQVVDKFTVAFNTNGGSYVEPIKVGLNEGVTRPAAPDREGYIFDDWYTNPELTTPFSFGTSVNSDTTLYAKWFKDISSATASGIVNKTYNGKNQTQNSIVVVFNNETLTKGTDYTLSYENNKNAGTATVFIKGIGEYSGSITKTFKILKAKNPLTLTYSSKTVYYSKVKSAAQVVKPIYVTKKVGTLKYTKLSESSNKLLLNTTTGKVTVKKGTKKGKYKIKIKVYASGNNNYYSNYGIRTVYITVK